MSQTPRLVELSVSLYRLLLAAYPVGFRNEYGEAMAQLFGDTARDAYRRRGLLGLMAVWLRTLLDLTVSVVRQHRQATSYTGDSMSLHHLVQQWLTLGGALLTVTVLSVRYAFHVILNRPLRTCAVVSTIILFVWVWSFFGHLSFAIKPFPIMLHCHIYGGVLEFRHTYYTGEPDLFPERFWQDPKNRKMSGEDMGRLIFERYWKNPKYRNDLTPVRPWEFSFSSGYWILVGFKPLQYAVLRIPVPALLVFVLLFYWRTRGRLRGTTSSAAAMQSA
jgi:hypothetical protein